MRPHLGDTGIGSIRRAQRVFPAILAAAAVSCLAVGFAGGCSTSPADTCTTISENICQKLDGCLNLSPTFLSLEQCVSSFNGFFEVRNDDDAACRAEWALAEELECAAFIDYFSI